MATTAKQAFEILVRENADMLRAFILSLVRNSDLAEEIFQETFLTVWEKLDSYDRERPFGSWLRGIAAVHAMAKKRQVSADKLHYVDEEVLSMLEEQFAKISNASGDTWEEKLDALKRCFESLPETSREIITLHYHKNHSCGKIASKLGLGLEMIKKRLQRARQALFDCISAKLARVRAGEVQ